MDDVVVTYEGGEKLFVQVKHTRSDNTLTFGDLVSVDNTSEDGSHRYSLLGELAQSWIAEKIIIKKQGYVRLQIENRE